MKGGRLNINNRLLVGLLVRIFLLSTTSTGIAVGSRLTSTNHQQLDDSVLADGSVKQKRDATRRRRLGGINGVSSSSFPKEDSVDDLNNNNVPPPPPPPLIEEESPSIDETVATEVEESIDDEVTPTTTTTTSSNFTATTNEEEQEEEEDENLLLRVGPFQARYFNGGAWAHTEVVEKPSINYGANDLFVGIDSNNFAAEWIGNLQVLNVPSLAVDIEFSGLSHATLVKVEIDGQSILLDDNNNKNGDDNFITQVNLTEGIHPILVEFENDWHTVGFNSFFGQRDWVTTAQEASTYIAAADEATTSSGLLMDDILVNSNTTYLVHVEIYESSDMYNMVTVTIDTEEEDKEVKEDGSYRSVFLILESYSSVNWKLDTSSSSLAEGIEISGILFGSFESATSVDTSGLDSRLPPPPVFAIPNGLLGGGNDNNLLSTILNGIPPSQVYESYDTSSITVAIS